MIPNAHRSLKGRLALAAMAVPLAAASAAAAPLVQQTQVYTERVGPNPVLAAGWQLAVGATNITPSGPGTTVQAQHLPLGSGPDYAVPATPSALFPNAYIAFAPYTGQTGRWQVTATDGSGSASATTHDLSDPRDLPLLTGLAASGPLLTPTFSWDRLDPGQYPSLCQVCVVGFDFFNYGLIVRDIGGPLLYQSSAIPNLPGTPTAWTLPAGVLQPDRSYLIGFRLNHNELEVINPNGSFVSPLENRSSAYMTYTTAVPEPASAALLGGGLLALMGLARLRGRAQRRRWPTVRRPAWPAAVALGIGLAGTAPVQAADPPYSGIYVFGDSLSDAGNVLAVTGGAVPLSPPYFAGRFSDGPNYADRLATGLGLAQNPIGLYPSLAPGPGVPFPLGSNYAWGGANSGPAVLPVGGLSVPPVYRPDLPGPGELPSQLQLYGAALQAAGTGADPGALYVVWTGGGDLRDAVNFAQTHPGSVLVDGEAVVSAALAHMQATLQTLQAWGATTVLVPNVPDLGRTPETLDWAAASSVDWLPAYATTLSGTYNLRLDALLDGFQGLEIIPFDAHALFNSIQADPAAYGLVNVTDPCLTTGAASIYIGGEVCADAATRLWWDNHHPSAATHQILGERMLAAAVPEPATALSLLLGLALLGAWARRRPG